MEHLKEILSPSKDQSHYHVIIGEYETGKTILTMLASREVGRGIIYIDVPESEVDFGIAFEAALNFAFEKQISLTKQLEQKIFGMKDDNLEFPKWKRALIAFKHAADVYIKNNPCHQPPVIIYDNISLLAQNYPKILDSLQDDAKRNADQQRYIAVFVSNKDSVSNRMQSRSSWSRAASIIEIGDLSEEESINYLVNKRNIKEKDAKRLYDLVGGRIIDLNFVAKEFLKGVSFEVIKQQAFSEVYHNLQKAKMNPYQANHDAAKIVIKALLNSNDTLHISMLRKMTNVEPNRLLGNIFVYHKDGTITFQSRSVECYMRENVNQFKK